MVRMNTATFAGAGLVGICALAGAQTSPAVQKPAQTPSAESRQITLTGCVRATSDDPKVLALVPGVDAAKPTGTTGTVATAPLYRLEDKGQKLKAHIGQRVEVKGTATPAKDEKGADIVMSRRENIGIDTVTVTTIDLKPAPRLDVTSVRKLAGECPTAADRSKGATAGTTGSSSVPPKAASVGEISEHPDRFIGQTVTVTGEVETLFGPRVFSLDEDRVFSTGVDLLVLSKSGITKDDQRVAVTGTVRKFVRAELQKEIVDFDLNPEWLVDFESRPVIIATEVTAAQGKARK